MHNERIKSLRPGLTGFMRAKNEGRFIGVCIDSVIDALDELIVVYNDCTDDTEAVLREKVKQYGGKVRIYAFNHRIYFNNLTPEEYDYALSLPENSPHLFCTQSNAALDHATFQYAVKIDADQIYFADEVQKWRDACCGIDVSVTAVQKMVAVSFRAWISFYRRISLLSGSVCSWLMPDWLVSIVAKAYIAYARHQLHVGKASIAWSGINVFVEDGKIFVPYDYRNVHPPYNGEGDLVLFKISPETKFTKLLVPGDKTRVLEYMNNPYPMWFCGPMWFHLHANRDYCEAKVSEMRRENPELFVDADAFLDFSYKDSLKLMRNGIPTLFQRTLFLLVHKINMAAVRRNLPRYRNAIIGIFDKDAVRNKGVKTAD